MSAIGDYAKSEWEKNAEVRGEFRSFDVFLHYCQAVDAGRVRIFGMAEEDLLPVGVKSIRESQVHPVAHRDTGAVKQDIEPGRKQVDPNLSLRVAKMQVRQSEKANNGIFW